ncbi:DUF2989 domain-containing protein [Shewanella inventionis]|uniref:DUF2989 domain-containing protein n=1 Tax=Shewanella inventionis TaxID=1738770 RepID=A0ABQ1JBA5_9GAMM|nr:DUF2989 domain-containing protein [Shewanella inventionis]MCL1157772.1 DUF2989 domain-containing protein [Shewanella inventionis]UAL41660.1 DUF2989 domain-containing protein [Shewanella inventionis]GGB63068.1 hypothetical protein GCM10011607_24740 [Shewanella inventionis]
MSQNFVLITSFTFIGAFFGLFGCDNDRNSDLICKNNPELCSDLHKDSWCRFEKGDLIRHRYLLKQSSAPTGKELYQQLIYLENYSKCIELAAGVQHKLNTDRTRDRERAFAVSTQTLAELQAFTQNNNDLHLAYYRWIRFNDQAGLAIVEQTYQQGQLTDPEIISQLAAHYVRYQPNDAKHLYLTLLANTEAELISPDWFLALASIYKQQQDHQKEYLLTRAYLLISPNHVNEEQLLAIIQGNKHLAQRLDQQATELIASVMSGSFANSASELLLK